MNLFIKKINLNLFFLFLTPLIFAKRSRIKVIDNNQLVEQVIENKIIDLNLLENKKNIKNDKDYKYVVFDVNNCFWKPSLYDLLMFLKRTVKIPLSGYWDLAKCGLAFAMVKLDAKKGYEIFFKYLKKIKKVEIQNKCDAIWENNCKNNIYKDAFERLEKHKKDGLITIAIDAGISPLYVKLKKEYKFDYIFSSKLEFKDGYTTGKLDGEPCSNKIKYDVVKKLVENNGDTLKDVIFYANSHNDIPLLEQVGKPIAVNPNKKLLKRARKSYWQVLYFSKIKNKRVFN